MVRLSVRRAGLWTGAVLSVAVAPQLAAQQDSSVARLQAQLEQVDQQSRITARQFELYRDSVAAAARTKPSVAAGASGFSLRSADGNFVLGFRGYFQSDARVYLSDDAKVLTNDLIIRRARPILEATVFNYYGVRIMPDFGGSAPAIFDAYFDARWKPSFGVRAGKFKPPVGLERLQSATDIKFIERGLPTNLVPSRDVGIQLSGLLGQGILSYEAGIFDGAPDLASGNNDIADGKDLVGRLFLTPFARQGATAAFDLGLGVAVSTGEELGTTAATNLPSYRSPGQATIFRYRSSSSAPVTGTVIADGRHTRIAPQLYLNRGPLGLLAEYTIARQLVARDTGVTRLAEKLEHKAWQVAGSFFLTGEKNSFKSVTPKQSFDPLNGGFGAVELVARYGRIAFDQDAFPTFADSTASVDEATAFAVGLDWHLGRNVKIGLNYEQTSFSGGAATGDRPDEKLLAARFQTAF